MALPGHPDFWGKLRRAHQARRTRLGLAMPIRGDRMPAPLLRVDDPIFPFGRTMIDLAGAQVCAYAIPLIPFLAEGAAGMVAMERLMRYLPNEIPIVLDLRWRDAGAAERCARAAFDVWGADAVTVAPEFPAEAAQAFAAYPGGAVFWWIGAPEDLEPAGRHARAARSLGLPAGLALGTREGSAGERLGDLPWIALDMQDRSELAPMAAWPPPLIVFVGEPILYASPRMDFEEAARAALREWSQAVNTCFPIGEASSDERAPSV